MPYDSTKMADWEIARAAEGAMPSPRDWQGRLGLRDEEVLPYGRVAKLHGERILARLAGRPRGKYIAVTAITPTPLGEGKTTTTLGLIEGLAARGLRAGGAIRQPSGGPSMNVKGTAAGGGNALLIPMTEFTLGLTGDIDAVTNAHNLAMVALTARILHEANYSDEGLGKRGLRRLDIDPRRVEMKWAIDFCAQALRHVVIGLGGRKDGVPMESGFQIAVSSELMAILAVARNLGDLRRRIGEITVAYSRGGKPVTCEDLEVAGAMAAWMRGALHPTLCSTIEYQPVLVHAGPFANIALGQSSILADDLGLRLWDYHVTESGFGADIGFEKLWNVKCRLSGLVPDAVVLTVTVRALKAHGGGPRVVPGHPLPKEYAKENLDLVEKGIPNLLHHLGIVRRAGVPAVVCLNRFPTDTDGEVALVRRVAEGAGAHFAVGEHWLRGGEGALELADAVVEACREKKNFQFLYPLETPLRERVERIARGVYGADGVSWTPEAEEKARAFDADPRFRDYATVMVKTHLSLSHNPDLKGVPKGWTLPIRDVLLFSGAKFLCPVAGDITLMPGTSSDPAFRRVDVDLSTGEVRGLF